MRTTALPLVTGIRLRLEQPREISLISEKAAWRRRGSSGAPVAQSPGDALLGLRLHHRRLDHHHGHHRGHHHDHHRDRHHDHHPRAARPSGPSFWLPQAISHARSRPGMLWSRVAPADLVRCPIAAPGGAPSSTCLARVAVSMLHSQGDATADAVCHDAKEQASCDCRSPARPRLSRKHLDHSVAPARHDVPRVLAPHHTAHALASHQPMGVDLLYT